MYHSNCLRTSLVGVNAQVHHIEDKHVKQHDYVTSSQSGEGLHHHTTSKMFNFVRTTVYSTLVVC